MTKFKGWEYLHSTVCIGLSVMVLSLSICLPSVWNLCPLISHRWIPGLIRVSYVQPPAVPMGQSLIQPLVLSWVLWVVYSAVNPLCLFLWSFFLKEVLDNSMLASCSVLCTWLPVVKGFHVPWKRSCDQHWCRLWISRPFYLERSPFFLSSVSTKCCFVHSYVPAIFVIELWFYSEEPAHFQLH